MIAQAPRRINLSRPCHTPLSMAEETAVITIMRRGGPYAAAARQKLVNANLKFVLAVARHFLACGLPMEDLINEGAAGLVRAAYSFEPTHGKFISYAVWWIRQGIMTYMHDHAHTIRIPSPTTLKTKLKTAETRKRPPRKKSTAATPEEAKAQIAAIHRLRHLESTHELVELGWEPADESQNPAEAITQWDETRRVERILGALKPKERAVVKGYFGLGTGPALTLEEVGEQLDLTRERVRQIKEKAMIRMRRAQELGRN
jgi:RNA polymerase primary sigma factor